MPVVTRRFGFDYAHKVQGHEGHCKYLHGHRGEVEVTVRSIGLDSLGRVLDFSEIKKLFQTWLLENVDHNALLRDDDPLLTVDRKVFGGREPFIMKSNPTAENIAAMLFRELGRLLPEGIDLIHIRFYETPNCWSDFPNKM